eukprot:CAMPEP_0198704346 /NCGR_PEP_ID=MMETSP1468-20131203/389856_1 /TAXON_ID=1461545 /ORGANISM="Mantoniella sp, Strain CCMP1436" /LENGTH=111 /DNA_ID=CAMNT_0044463157 /DNA_START=425 /DNA_END=756 /DNA_ORIENTATION=-
MMHLATAAHANQHRAWRMGGSWCQCSSLSTINASHDEVCPLLLQPPRTAKRPSLITHPQEPRRSTISAGSCVQIHAPLDAPLAGGPQTSAEASKPPYLPPAHATRPSGMRT